MLMREKRLHPELSIVKDVKFNFSNGMNREEMENFLSLENTNLS